MKSVPAVAAWLGALGAVPFVVLALAIPYLDEEPRAYASFVLAAYGAVILSFLGGIRWGLAIAQTGAAPNGRQLAIRLVASVVPALTGWVALLLPAAPSLALLATGFALMLALDLGASADSGTPPWYPRLRVPLSIVVIASTGLALFWSH